MVKHSKKKCVNSGKIGRLNFRIVIGNSGYVGSYGCNYVSYFYEEDVAVDYQKNR